MIAVRPAVAWFGPSERELGWLRSRVESVAEIVSLDNDATPEWDSAPVRIGALDALCRKNPQRLILSTLSRLLYPLAEIQHAIANWPEIPLAVAMGSWYDGARRTGIGPACYPQWSWHRWWDAWNPWLIESTSGIFDPWPRVSELALAVDPARLSPEWSGGCIVCDCNQTASAWKSVNPGIEVCTSLQMRQRQASASGLQWLLWDDSCLRGRFDEPVWNDTESLLECARQLNPACLMIAATTMPRIDDWERLRHFGVTEFISKPFVGRPLARILSRTGSHAALPTLATHPPQQASGPSF